MTLIDSVILFYIFRKCSYYALISLIIFIAKSRVKFFELQQKSKNYFLQINLYLTFEVKFHQNMVG